MNNKYALAVVMCVGSIGSYCSVAADSVYLKQRISNSVPSVFIFDVSINGNEASKMVFDTGATHTILDIGLQSAVGAEASEINVTGAAGEKVASKLFEAPLMSVQGLTLKKSAVILTDLQSVKSGIDRNLSGVLGVNAFDDAKIFVNYDEELLIIHGGSWLLSQGFREIALLKDSLVPKFEAQLGSQLLTFMIDTGYDGTINLPNDAFDSLVEQGFIEPSKLTPKSLSLGGMYSNRKGWFIKGSLMGKELSGVTVISKGEDAFLGLSWLCGFNLEIDFQNRIARYSKRTAPIPPIAIQLMTGAVFFFDISGAVVGRLQPDGKGGAELAGLKVGDTIKSFAGLKPEQMNLETIKKAVFANAGKTIRVTYQQKATNLTVDKDWKILQRISSWDFAGKNLEAEKGR